MEKIRYPWSLASSSGLVQCGLSTNPYRPIFKDRQTAEQRAIQKHESIQIVPLPEYGWLESKHD